MTHGPTSLTRRGLVAGLAALPLAGCAAELGLEPKLPRRRFRALRVDTSAMTKSGVPNWAARVGAAVEAAARPAFADMIDPRDRRAPVLVLELEAANMPIWRVAREKIPLGDFGADHAEDWIAGHVVAGATRRRVAITRDARDAGPWYLPDIDQRRLDGVAALWVAWARREFEG